MALTMTSQIFAAYVKLRRKPGGWVKLASLREHLTGTRKQQDAALTTLADQKLIVLIPEENQKTLRAADREAAIIYGAEPNHLIMIEPESSVIKATPVKKAAKATPVKKAAKAAPAKKAAKATPAKKAATRAPKGFPMTFLPRSVGGGSEKWSDESRTAQVSARLEPSLKAEFARQCKANGVSEAAAIRMGILALLGKGNE